MNKGYVVILAGYVGWGLFPLYWSLLIHVPALEVLLHRMLWSVPFLLLLVLASERRRRQVTQALKSWGELRWLTLSSLVIALNWGLYIWAVANQRVVEASMGYFLTPLFNVLTGVVFFGEKLDRGKSVAVACAAAGVAYYMFATGELPWISLAVGISFALYGLLRKKMVTNPVPGLFIEVMLLLPVTLAAIAWLHLQGSAMFLNHSQATDWWLILAGPVTVIPLALFTAGSRLLPMTSVGILFYVTPSLQFLCGTLILGEAFNLDKLIGFIGIWIGLVIFSVGLVRGNGASRVETT